MKKYKVAQVCGEQEMSRLGAERDESKVRQLKRDQALAVATAVEALATLQQQETKRKLEAAVSKNSASEQKATIPLSSSFLN